MTVASHKEHTLGIDALKLIHCPCCDQGPMLNVLSNEQRKELTCSHCHAAFPTLNGVPVLVPAVQNYWARNKMALHIVLAKLNAQIEELREASKNFPLDTSRLRIKNLRSSLINRKRLFECVLPELIESNESNVPMLEAPLDINQYYINLIRDWSDDYSEQERHAQIANALSLFKQIPAPARDQKVCLIPGAGASRIALELALEFPLTHFVAIDLNPFLIGAAAQLMSGKSLDAPEQPIAPRTSEYPMHHLQSPHKRPENLSLLLGDVFALPFQPASIDLICTPWLIDIVAKTFFETLAPLSKLLKIGGHWLNFGSFNFQKSVAALQYSPDEIPSLLNEGGLSPINHGSYRSPYLVSAASSQHRSEEVHYFLAKKVKEFSSRLEDSYIKGADLDPDKPLDLSENLKVQMEILASELKILSYINGKNSLAQAASALSRDFGMPLREAQILLKKYYLRKQSL